MNKNILKGKWLETKGLVKVKWGKLTDDELCGIEGKSEMLLGRLLKQYGYIKDKAEPEYKDHVELADIVSRIRKMMTKRNDVMAIAFIARYGQPLLGKKQERQITGKEKKHGNDTYHHFDSRLGRRTANLASQ